MRSENVLSRGMAGCSLPAKSLEELRLVDADGRHFY